LGEKGAVVFFVPGAWRREHIRLWRTLLIARAIENQVFVVGVNRCDKGKNFSFGGQSMIIDPFGDVLVHLGENQTIESVSLDLNLVDEARRKNSIVSSKRPALYRKWK
jgi:predicted amidohydrolase